MYNHGAMSLSWRMGTELTSCLPKAVSQTNDLERHGCHGCQVKTMSLLWTCECYHSTTWLDSEFINYVTKHSHCKRSGHIHLTEIQKVHRNLEKCKKVDSWRSTDYCASCTVLEFNTNNLVFQLVLKFLFFIFLFFIFCFWGRGRDPQKKPGPYLGLFMDTFYCIKKMQSRNVVCTCTYLKIVRNVYMYFHNDKTTWF